MTYGSPATLEDIPAYLRNIRGGREPDEALVAEFRRRYTPDRGLAVARGSPGQQAAALEAELNGLGDGNSYTVVAGMRFSPPLIADVVQEAAPRVGVPSSASSCRPSSLRSSWADTCAPCSEAVAGLHRDGLALKIAEDWHLQPYFLEALSQRVTEALDQPSPGRQG